MKPEFNIRITRRTELGDRAHEESIDIDFSPRALSSAITAELTAFPTVTADPPAGLEWSATLCDGKPVKHAAAIKACTELGEGWRLPTRTELLSLVDDTRSDPSIDTARFPDTKSGAYWTSTPLASGSSYAWFVSFDGGLAGGCHRGDSLAFVRAVRSVPAGQ